MRNITKLFKELKYFLLGSLWWLFPEGILRENPVIFLINPFVSFPAIWRNIRWMWQRIYRGWDDRATWSIDYWLDNIMPDILRMLKKNKHGTPLSYFPDNYIGDNPEIEKLASDKWDEDLEKMIRAFEIGKEIENLPSENYIENYKELETEFMSNMVLFIKNYRSLWD